jgi:hypothetical protein
MTGKTKKVCFTPFRIENAKSNVAFSVINAHDVGVLNEKRCKRVSLRRHSLRRRRTVKGGTSTGTPQPQHLSPRTPSSRTPSPRTPSPRTPSPRTPGSMRTPSPTHIRRHYTLASGTKGLRYHAGTFVAAELTGLPRAKRIMLYGGCFCPPHKGHFAIVEKNLKNYDAIYIFIWGKGISRHGYSATVNAKLWDLYLQTLPVKDQAKVHLVSTPNDNSNPLVAGVKIILPLLEKQNPIKIHAKMGSDYSKDDTRDILEVVKQLVQPILLPNTSIAYSERVKLNVTKRDLAGGPSATNFCRSLRKITKDETTESDIDRFLPSKVNSNAEIKKAVVELLLSECEL